MSKSLNSDEKWKNHLIWKHGMKTLFPKQYTGSHETQYNRYYHRGSSPFGINTPNCCDNYLEHDRKYGNTVVSHNNPFADDNPGFSRYLTFSIFGDRVLTSQDIAAIKQYYNKHQAILDGERLYGPFNQKNLNIISETAYNEENWNQGWRGYHHWNNLDIPVHPNLKKLPVLYQVAHHVAIEYLKAMNRAMISLRIKTFTFHLAKNKIVEILRSTQTHYIKYIMNVALIRNTEAKVYVFEAIAYYDPNENKLKLGKTIFIGSGTTDSMLLPKGKDPNIYKDTGRPLHPLKAKDSEMMPFDEANDLYWQHLYATNHYTQNLQYKNELPYWFKSRHGKEQVSSQKTGYGSIASMFPDKTPEQTKCFLKN